MAEARGPWNKIVPNWTTLLALLGTIVLAAVIIIPNIEPIEPAYRAACASNLKQIGVACQAWAAGHKQNWPCGYDPGSERWDEVGNTRSIGLQKSKMGGDLGESIPVNSNTASLWMLLKAGLVQNAEVFICPSTDDKAELDVTEPAKSPIRDFRSPRGCSYSFQNVLPGSAGYVLTSAASPALAVAADANPMRRNFCGGAPDGAKNGVTDKRLAENPDLEVPGWGKAAGAWELNSPNHDFKGQNVLYLDGHVDWWNDPYCGQAYDNIWLPQVYGAARRDDLPKPDPHTVNQDVETLRAYNCTTGYDGRMTLPAKNRTDSFLVP